MGSSVESALVFSTVLLIITFLITEPLNIVADSLESEEFIYDRIELHTENNVIYEENSGLINSAPENLCTVLTGISDSYRLIYDGIVNYFNYDEEDSSDEA